MGSSAKEDKSRKAASSSQPKNPGGRSQSPKAKEKRKLQNRLAQRNHRRRLKEQSSTSSEESGDPHDHQSSPAPTFEQSPIFEAVDSLETFSTKSMSPLVAPLMADDAIFKSDSSFQSLEPLIPQGPGTDAFSTNFNPFAFPLSQGCGCNGVTGPCSRHLDEIKSQVFSNNMSVNANFSQSPFPEAPPASTGYASGLGLPAVAFEGKFPSAGLAVSQPQVPPPPMNSRPTYHPLATEISASPPKETGLPSITLDTLAQLNKNATHSPRNDPSTSHRHSNSTTVSKPSPGSRNTSSAGAGTPMTPPTSEESISLSRSNTTTSSPNPLQLGTNRRDSTASTSADTARFNTILDSVSSAGFPDFDRMVAAYYTSSFERGSVPDISQRASRGRRLGKVVKDVHKSSRKWARWEAKGLRESCAESAKKIYVEEMERVAQHLEQQRRDRSENVGQAAKTDVDLLDDGLRIFNGSSSSENTVHGNLEDAGHNSGDTQEQQQQLNAMPEDVVEAVVQDEAPHLWSLLTELAGPQGFYCDQVSQRVLALLINGQQRSC